MIALWCCLSVVILYSFPGPFERLDHKIYDLKLSLTARPSLNNDIVHVDVDDAAVRAIGPWPWDRSVTARIVDRLRELGAKVVVLDILYSTTGKSPDGDAALFKAVSESRTVISAFCPITISLEKGNLKAGSARDRAEALYSRAWLCDALPGYRFFCVKELRASSLPLLPIIEHSAALGHIKATPDSDGVFRRLPLVIQLRDRFVPSLGLAALLTFLDAGADQVRLEDRHIKIDSRDGTVRIPVDTHANCLIHWRPTWDSFAHYSALDILSDIPDPKRMARYKNKIVILGVACTGIGELGANSLESEFLVSRIHSSLLDTILSQRAITKVEASPFTIWGGVLLTVIFALVSARLGMSRQIALFACIVAVSMSGVLACFLLAFVEIPVVEASFVFVPSAVACIVSRGWANERQRKMVQETFGRFVSNEVVQEILETPGGVDIKGELKEVTFLVADIRGFTPLTESLPPAMVVTLINRFLERMTEIVFRYGGSINEVLGDGILVFFGVPREKPDAVRLAVRCALEMQESMDDVNAENRRAGLPPIEIGIGVNTGLSIVGNIGSEKRKKYTAVGSPINVTFRITAEARAGEVLITSAVYEKVGEDLQIDSARHARLKGIKEPVTLYPVTSMNPQQKHEP